MGSILAKLRSIAAPSAAQMGLVLGGLCMWRESFIFFGWGHGEQPQVLEVCEWLGFNLV